MLGAGLPVASGMQMIRELLRKGGRQPTVPVAVLALGGIAGTSAAREIGEHLPSPHHPSPAERVRDGAGAMGVSEKAVAAFAATFIAKAVSGYFRWRGEEKARAQAEALAGGSGRDFEERLEDRTVVELRQTAAEREIDGRSSMNEALIEALGEGR